MKKRINSRLIPAFIICLSAFVFAGCAKKPQENKPVKIAINVWPGYAHVFIAQEKGFFKKNGVNVELILNKAYIHCKELLEDSAVDAAFLVYPDVIISDAQGRDYKIVYISDYSLTADVIIGRPEFQSLADLKGRTVSFEGVNTFSHIFVLSALEKYGLKESEVNFANVHALEVLDALEQGKIDAGHTWEPVTSEALKKGCKILANAEEIPIGIITDTLVFRGEAIEKNPQQIKMVVKSLFEALDYLKNNQADAVKIMSDKEGMSEEEIKSGLKGIKQPGIKENLEILTTSRVLHNAGEMILDFYIKRGQISGRLDIKNIIDPRFVEELSK